MELKQFKDVDLSKIDIVHFNATLAQNISANSSSTITTDVDLYIRITPINIGTYVSISDSAVSITGTGTGMTRGLFIPYGQSLNTIYRVGEHINTTEEINVVPMGEL